MAKKKIIPVPETKPEEPVVPNTITKKIDFKGKEVYIVRVFLKAVPILKKRPVLIYSAWETIQPDTKYSNTMVLNDILLGQMGTQELPETFVYTGDRKKLIEEGYEAICLASKEAADKGKRRGFFIYLEK